MPGNPFICPLIALALLSACDATAPSDHNAETVIEAYLIADAPLPEIRVFRTEDINADFEFDRLAVSNASVSVSLLGNQSNPERQFGYVPHLSRRGVYLPEDEHSVIPGRNYLLDVRIPGDPVPVSAETTIPGRFEIVRVNADTLVYQAEEQYSVSITRSEYPGRQAIYIQSVEALDPGVRRLTPLYLDEIYGIKDENDADLDFLDPSEMDPYILGSSHPINEQNYDVNPDGSLIIPLPWFGVAFYGNSRVSTTAIDDALYDFIRFQTVQQGGSTLSPGEIPDVLDHIENGRGVFGGMARVESIVHILRKDDSTR